MTRIPFRRTWANWSVQVLLSIGNDRATDMIQSLFIVDQYVVDRLTFRILTLGCHRHNFAVF